VQRGACACCTFGVKPYLVPDNCVAFQLRSVLSDWVVSWSGGWGPAITPSFCDTFDLRCDSKCLRCEGLTGRSCATPFLFGFGELFSQAYALPKSGALEAVLVSLLLDTFVFASSTFCWKISSSISTHERSWGTSSFLRRLTHLFVRSRMLGPPRDWRYAAECSEKSALWSFYTVNVVVNGLLRVCTGCRQTSS